MAHIASSIFRAYDIRGQETEGELNASSFTHLGRAYGTYCRKQGNTKVVAGCDSRESSGQFLDALIEGLTATGCDVINLGVVLTPMMYWAQYHFNTKAGAVVTASHNPLGWNGVKFAKDFSLTMPGEELLNLYDIIAKDTFFKGTKGAVIREDIKDEYLKDVVSRVSLKNKPKVLVSTGNGTAGLYAPELFRKAGCEVVEWHTEIDSTYPHYMPNPIDVEMIEDTQQGVLESGADFGVMFDGDGDRVGLIDNEGRNVIPDHLLLLLIYQLAGRKKGIKVVRDVSCTDSIADEVLRLGGEVFFSKIGHVHGKKTVQDVDADLGGESSGHFVMKDNYYGFDDGLFAGVTLADHIVAQGKKVSALVDEIPKYATSPRWYRAVVPEKKAEIIATLQKEFQKEGYEVTTIDGVRVIFEHGFGLIRSSNTINSIMVRAEAKTHEQLKEIEGIVKHKIQASPFVVGEWTIQ